jgi:hypothetical protein
MLVLKRTKKGYKQDPTKQFQFERFESECGDFVLVEAAFEEDDKWGQFELSNEELDKIKSKKIIRLEFEEPNKFFLGDKMESYDHEFHKIYTLCPYTSDWLNKKEGIERRVPIYFPFNENDIPPISQKIYDVIYTGHIVSKKLLDDLKIIAKFNHRFVSNDQNNLVTNQNASYNEKIKLISESKITLVHNLLHPKRKYFKNIWNYEGWQNHEGFKLIPKPTQFWKIFTDKNIVVPQLKSRVFEAAFSRSLILCKRDQFNVIEKYFEPNKEFIYYENNLEEKITEILENYHLYENIIENAFKRAIINYTTKAFVNDYLKHINLV